MQNILWSFSVRDKLWVIAIPDYVEDTRRGAFEILNDIDSRVRMHICNETGEHKLWYKFEFDEDFCEDNVLEFDTFVHRPDVLFNSDWLL